MIARDEYLKHLIAFKDKPVVKVITGIRRCGKSTLLMLYADWLKKNGVESKQIISINLESARYDNVKDYKTLYNEVASKIRTDEKYYVLLDEVQNVAEFERAVESLSIDHNVDIYITGSNAYMLSSELATLCAEFGMSANTAMNVFANAVVQQRRIPFIIKSGKDDFLDAFKEMRARADAGLTPDMTMEEIDEEIRQARAERRKQATK